MKRLLSYSVGAAALFAVPSAASAVTLFNQVNMPQQFVTPVSASFTATSTSTVIDFQAYQLPGTLALVNIFLGTTGSPVNTANNLLGTHFNATPSGCSAPGNTFGEGSLSLTTGTNDITFGGTCVGLYDSLAQTVSTTVGTSYTLRFSFSNIGQGPNGFRIFATDAVAPPAAVPEPATWAMMLLGFAGIGFQLRRSRKKAVLPQVA